MNHPFFDAIESVSRRSPRFFMPGHKGNSAALPAFKGLLQYDITEVDGAFDLSCPSGALAESETNMSCAFGTAATLYSASGSTSCILAMLALFAGEGGHVVMARGAHVSAIRALALLDITPYWVVSPSGQPSPQAIAQALEQSGAKVVYITSPNYYGHMADVAGIATVCHRFGAKLLVDNAHGAYLAFLQPSLHPIQLGADACADSAHKTLPCLTPAALLHLADASLKTQARQTLNLFCSTSPSYPVMLSLDLCASQLLQQTPDFTTAAVRLQKAGQGFAEIVEPCDEPLKLRLCPALAGIDGRLLEEALLQQDIAAEYADGERLIFMASPWNTPEDFDTLFQTLDVLSHRKEELKAKTLQKNPTFEPTATLSGAAYAPLLPKAACSVRKALFAAKCTLPTQQALGRICASLMAPCPPGVPLVLPGEVLCEESIRRLLASSILHIDVVK